MFIQARTQAAWPEQAPAKALFLLLLLMLFREVQALDFTYINTNGTITITGYNGLGGAVAIPSTINGLPVTSIGDQAFVTNYYLTSVTIPSSITNIGMGAFFQCENLTSAIIAEGATTIRDFVFTYCFKLSQVTIPNSVTSIGFQAFFACYDLTNITIPNSVTNIADQVFVECDSLIGVYFKGNAPTVGPQIFHAPPNPTVYYLMGTTGWGPTFAGAPTVLWNPRLQTSDSNFGVRSNRFGFNIAGPADIPLVVEASCDLAARCWVPLQSCTLTNGLIYFSDPQWTNYSGRLYRTRSP